MDLEKYKKEDLETHIYKKPDTYVGGCDLIDETLPVFNNNKIEFKLIDWIPAIFKLFDEIIVNSLDQTIRMLNRFIYWFANSCIGNIYCSNSSY